MCIEIESGKGDAGQPSPYDCNIYLGMLHGGKEGEGKMSAGLSPAQLRGRWREMAGSNFAKPRERAATERESETSEKSERERENWRVDYSIPYSYG